MNRILLSSRTALLVMACMVATGDVARAQDLPIAEFDGTDFGVWQVMGEAFRLGPARGNLLAKLEIANSRDAAVASSEMEGDRLTGTLLSPLFKIERRYVAYAVGGGDYERHACIDLLVEGKVVRRATGRNSDKLQPGSWEVGEFRGRTGQLRIVDEATGTWGHINVDYIRQTDSPEVLPVTAGPLYQERLRPQFHFTARQWAMNRLNPGMRQEGWINDLNGLIFYDGEYHLFAQRWAKCWLHAVSKDLIHWEELPPAFWEEELDSGVQSGTCIIDYQNTSGLSPDQSTPPMVAIWSRFDNKSHCLCFSLDHGRTWRRHSSNPVLTFPERDPKVFWHEPTRRWVMMMYGGGQYHIFTSPNLLQWQDEKNPIPNSFECPDFFELPVDGDAKNKKWVLIQGSGKYSVGQFDGRKYAEETPRLDGDINLANFYATQSWHNTDTGDGRRIQAAWMRGSQFPDMPFSQQISFPCELSLRSTAKGLRLFRQPIREIELLQLQPKSWVNEAVKTGQSLNLTETGELFRLRAELLIPASAKVTFTLRGVTVVLTADSVRSGEATAKTQGQVKSLEVLLDRASLEAFVNAGEISCTRYVLPTGQGISVTAEGGEVLLKSLALWPLRSAWEKPPQH